MDNQTVQEKQLDALTEKLYGSISFEEGGSPPVQWLNDIFLPEGLLIKNDGNIPNIRSVKEYIKAFKQLVDSGEIKSFYEGELSSITEICGKIAHRFSTYETKFDLTKDEPFSLGINAIQFVKVGEQWFISSIAWNNQTGDLRIPEKYLHK